MIAFIPLSLVLGGIMASLMYFYVFPEGKEEVGEGGGG